jgi:hypothetical protein
VKGVDTKALSPPFAGFLVLVMLAAHVRHLTNRAFGPSR